MNEPPDFATWFFDRVMPLYAVGVIIACWIAGCALSIGLIAALIRRALS